MEAGKQTILSKSSHFLAKNREHLIQSIDSAICADFNPKNEKHFYLVIVREDCGCKIMCKNREDIPLHTVFCKHDNPIIIYSDETPESVKQKMI